MCVCVRARVIFEKNGGTGHLFEPHGHPVQVLLPKLLPSPRSDVVSLDPNEVVDPAAAVLAGGWRSGHPSGSSPANTRLFKRQNVENEEVDHLLILMIF